MTARVLHYVLDYFPHGGGEYALAIAIADDADDRGEKIRLGVPQMARKSRQSEKQVRRLLVKLQADGWLQLVEVKHGRGESAFAEFRINPQWMQQCAQGGGRLEVTDGASEPVDWTKCPVNTDLTGQNDRTKCPVNADLTGQNVQSIEFRISSLNTTTTTTSPPTPPQSKKSQAIDQDDLIFCKRFLATLRKLNPGHPEPTHWHRWATAVRLMREVDGHSLQEMGEMVRWVADDEFWAANILSPTKLRAKWPQLAAKRALAQRKGRAQGEPVTAESRACGCGCGQRGSKSFRTDGTDWWCAASYEAEKLRRELAA